MPEYSEIIRSLAEAILKLNILFKIPDRNPALDKIFHRKLILCTPDVEIPFFADDEYEDVDQENPVFLLNMVLLECESIELTDSFEDWCIDVGLSAHASLSQEIYTTNKQSRTQLLDLLPPDITHIPQYEIEFGTSVATALRNATFDNSSK